MKCPKCSCEDRVKSGKVKDRQRYKCKECGCNYTVEMKSTAKPHSLKRQALHLYLEGLGFRSIGRLLGESNVLRFKLDNASKERVYNDWIIASPSKKAKTTPITQMQMDPIVFADTYRSLTDIQIKFIERIIDEYAKSSSYEDLSDRLLKISKDIHTQVSEIEQERLFYITAILYYGMREVQNIEKQGLMSLTPNSKPVMRLKSGNESGGGGFWGACRQISAYVWTLAVGEIYYAAQAVEIVTEVTAAAGLFLVTLCAVGLAGDTDWNVKCSEKYATCMNGSYGNPNSGGYGYTLCVRRLEYCRVHHIWDCPRPL